MEKMCEINTRTHNRGQNHRRSQDFWLVGAQTLKNSAVFTEIESEFSAEIGNSNDFSAQIQVISKKKKKKRSSPKLRVVFRPKPLPLLLLYCLITVMCAITEKKLQLNIVRLCCHNFLSLVEFWLGGARAPWAPPSYAYGQNDPEGGSQMDFSKHGEDIFLVFLDFVSNLCPCMMVVQLFRYVIFTFAMKNLIFSKYPENA